MKTRFAARITPRITLGITLGSMAQLSSVGLLLTSAWLIVRAAEHPPVLYLMVAIVSVRFFGLGRAVFRYAERLLTHDVALRRTTDDRVRVYRDLERTAPFGLPRQRRGDTISRAVRDVDVIQDGLLRIRLPWTYAVITSISVTVLVAFLSPLAGVILAVHVALCMIVVGLGVGELVREPDADTYGSMAAGISMIALTSRDLVAYGATDRFAGDIDRSINRLAAYQRASTWIAGLGSAVVIALTGMTMAALALVVGDVSPVQFGVLLLAPLALLEPLESLAESERLRPGVEAARQRLDELAAIETPIVEPALAHPLPSHAALAVEDLEIGWERTLTHPVSFTLAPGHLLGIAGPSGVGKSTMALTLAKLVQPRGGHITLGGVDYAELDGADIRATVGVSVQDDVLFDTTIRENLRIAEPTAPEQAMHAALTQAGLDGFVEQLPRGLDTAIGEHGNHVSGGERQRLAIARLCLAGHSIVIFDEPTEHLDEPAADALLEVIAGLAKTHAVAIISHSPRVLARCARVVRLVPLPSSPTRKDHDHEPEQHSGCFDTDRLLRTDCRG
ncbi:N/A [soil metagenome]